MRTRIKICCIAPVAEAHEAIDAGADALGLVAKMPSGPGPISDAAIREIACQVPPGVDSVPVYLAGGLNPENVKSGISQVVPFGVDLCSGVRSHDKLDLTLLRRFIESVRETSSK